MYSGGVQSMGSISKPFFRFPLSEGPGAGGQHRATQGQTGPSTEASSPAPSWWQGLAPSPFTSPWPICPWTFCPTPSPNASRTSQVAISKDTQEGQGVAVNPIEGIRWVKALEQVPDVAHVDAGLTDCVRFCREGERQRVSRACPPLHQPAQHREVGQEATTVVLIFTF